MSQLKKQGMPRANKVFTGPLNWIFHLYTYILKRKFKKAGKKCSFHPLLNINHPENISIGDDVVIGSFSWIGTYGENGEPFGELIMGNRVHIGSYSTIIARSKIRIGNNVLMSQRVVILDNIH